MSYRVHTYWFTYEEYMEYSKRKEKKESRIHIYFV